VGTFVLVHGAWHGGRCYKRVARLLRQAGHEAYMPTLTGLGERAHLISRTIDLATHIPSSTRHTCHMAGASHRAPAPLWPRFD
jgi:hypothetical protein